MNRSIGDIIFSFIDSLTTFLRSLDQNLLRAYSHLVRICLRLAVVPHALHRSDVVNPQA